MNTKRFTAILFLLLTLVLPLTAQGITEVTPVSSDVSRIYVDSYDRAVEIPENVNRVVSLGPNITEIIFALGKGDTLVGRTDYCDYPEEVADIPSIGTLTDPNIETVIDLAPDLVIGSTHTPKEALDRIEDAGITTVGIYTDTTFEGTYKTILDTGIILGAAEEAQQIIDEMKATISDIKKTVADAPRPSVYYVVGFGEWGDFTAGGDTFINDIIEIAGGDNIAKDVTGWSYSLEKIIENDPDIIICSKYWGIPESFAATPGYKDLRAVREGHLYAFDNNLIDRQGVRNAEGARALAKIFHPDLF